MPGRLVLLIFPLRELDPIPLDMEFPPVVELPFDMFDIALVFDDVVFDIVDVVPNELLLIEFIELALLAPLELYVLVLLLEVPLHAIRPALTTSNNPKAKDLFIY